jgi:hypothetical protein
MHPVVCLDRGFRASLKANLVGFPWALHTKLFLEKRGLQLRSETMKGAAPRSADALTDTHIL